LSLTEDLSILLLTRINRVKNSDFETAFSELLPKKNLKKILTKNLRNLLTIFSNLLNPLQKKPKSPDLIICSIISLEQVPKRKKLMKNLVPTNPLPTPQTVKQKPQPRKQTPTPLKLR
jgi:hypothetical protein